MCGRYTLTAGMSDLERLDWYDQILTEHTARYNIAPSQRAPVVARNSEGVRGLVDMRWGLVPSWAEDPEIGHRMINARWETAHAKPAFRAAFRRRRCLVVTDGFYEWQKLDGGPKQPYWIHRPDRELFAFAGLWESWRDEKAEAPLLTFTIVTRDATDDLRPIHERMPLVLDGEGREAWLRREADPEELREWIEGLPRATLSATPVSTYVNDPTHEGPECIEG